MKALLLVPALAAFVVSSAWADQKLAESRNCLGCHSVNTRQGPFPSYREIAAKYAGQKDATAQLSHKIQKGGTGAWGAIPMPANPHVSDADAKALAAWIMSIK